MRLRHRRYPDAAACTAAIAELCQLAATVDFLDGTVFDAGEQYLTTGEFVDALPARRHRERLHRAADLLPVAAASGRSTT